MGARKRTGRGKAENLYERAGIFYARVQINNREHRRSLKTDDRKIALKRLNAWLAEVSPYHGNDRHLFKEAANLWMEAGERQWKPKTAVGYVKLFKTLDARLGHLYWDQVDKALLQTFIAERRAAGNTTATINRYLTVISGIANHVKELPGWPEVNPVTLLAKKPLKPKRWHYVRPPAGDIEAYFDRMKGTFGDLCRFALLTGGRMDEIAGLKRDDVTDGRAHLWDTKSGHRTISLPAGAQEIAQRQPSSKSGYLFVSRHDSRYKRVSEMWREVVIRAQKMAQRDGRSLTRMRFHDLRHEYAIRYLENGGSIYTLKELMGHGTIGQTERYLRYLTPEQAERAKFGSAQ